MTPDQRDRIRAQRALVEEHVRRENAHDLPGIMDTFGSRAWYDDEPWGEHHEGRPAVQGYYEDLLVSLPDLRIDITHCLAAEDGVALEVRISGTHLGAWRGLPAMGRRVDFPLCGLYTFDDAGKLAGERIYYDRASVLRQVGLFHDPQSLLGRLETLCAHPITVAGAYARKVLRVAGLVVAMSLGARGAHAQETAPLDGPQRPFQDSLFERLTGTWLMSGSVGTRPATYSLDGTT
jgi:steroid delta-isomerase-like uncharacterized protein